MGISKFSDAFSRAFVPVKSLGDVVKGKSVALDMHLLLYKSIKALGHMTLTDSSGVPTSGINNLLNLVPKLRKAGAARIIAVFDNPEGGCPLKKKECEKRRAHSEEYKVRAESEENVEKKAQLETRAWTIDSAVIYDAQHLLTLLGVESHIAPVGIEAEHYAAYLTRIGVAEIVISDDSDSVMFGALKTLFPRTSRIGKTTYKYSLIVLEDLLREYAITYAELQKICIALGWESVEKTRNVGAVTALTRGKNMAPTDEQKAALMYVASDPDRSSAVIIPGKLNLPEAAVWLSDSKGFNYSRVAKILGVSAESIPLVMPTATPAIQPTVEKPEAA
jgi:hypothetical protein